MNVTTLPIKGHVGNFRYAAYPKVPADPLALVAEADPTRAMLLRAIVADRDDDTPRLAYADHLDEHGTTDCDRATAEFIRLDCDGVFKRENSPVPRRVRAWLYACCERLVPSLMALSDEPYWAPPEPYYAHSGRYTFVRLWLPGRVTRRECYVVALRYRRGFVDRCICRSDHAALLTYPALLADQPLATLRPARSSTPSEVY